MNRVKHPVLAVFAVLGILLGAGWFTPASAHASLLSSDPADGQRLDALPTAVSLEFSERISQPAYVVVTAPDGSRVDDGEAETVDNRVSTTVTGEGAAEGTYGVVFRVVSADGHPVTGELTFVVGDGPLGEAPTAAAQEAEADSAEGSAEEPGADSPYQDEPVLSLRHFQIGIGLVLASIVGGLVWWSRRSDR